MTFFSLQPRSRFSDFSARRIFQGLTVAVLGLFAVVIVCGRVAFAQLETGQISGTVLDQTEAAVPGATIAVRNTGTNSVRNTVSSSTGAFQVTGLAPATYAVTITSASFRPFNATVEVTVGGHVNLDAKLSVNATVTEVQVVGEGGAQVNTQTQELSQIVDSEQLAALPSLTRNPYDFVSISGNVSSGDNTTNSSNSGQNLTNRGVGYAINGQRESGTEILLDGAENVSIFSVAVGEDIPMDSVQEYSVLTNNYSAEYGRASGGVVNVTTKAGTNQIHGSAWGYNRLSAYTANTYANDAANFAAGPCGGPTSANPCPDPKGTYTRNQFGYAAGGPIIKDKLFIFESTEWTRVRSAATESEEIFDPGFIAMLPANIQAYYKTYGQTTLKSAGTAATVGDIVNTCQFGSTSTTACVNPTAFPLVNGTTAIPTTQAVFDTVNFSAPFDAGGGIPENAYDLVGRVDFNPTDKTQMFFRGARENENQFVGSDFYSAYPQFDAGTAYANQSYLFSLSHTFSPSVFLSAKASYTRFSDINSFDAKLTDTPNLMFVSPTDPVTGGEIQMPGLQNYSEPGAGGLPYGGPQNTIQYEPDLSWTKGKHSMRFGWLGTYIQMNVAYGAYAQAVEQLGADFSDSMGDMVNSAGDANGATLISFQARVDPQGKLPCAVDIYGNEPSPVPSSCLVQPPLQSASYARSYRYKDWSTYAQDSYKLTPKLNLDFGIRYEHYGVQHNNNQALDSNFYFGSGNGVEEQTASGGVFTTQNSPIGAFWKPRWGTIAPRVGFAYDLFGNGRDSIRGGYGVSYERNFGNVTFNASFNPPASAVISDTCAAGDASCAYAVTNQDLGPLGVAGAAAAMPPVELRHLDQNIQVAQTQFWSFAVEHQLTHGTVIEVSYGGAKGDHLYDLANVNQAGAAQIYLGQPLVEGPQCANSGYVDNNTGADSCLTRPTQQYTNINMRGSAAGSAYNALNVKFQTQNLHSTGLSVVGNYTWSRSRDDLSSTFGDSLQGGSGYVGSLGYTSLEDPKLDWGPSDFDQPQRIALAPIWETPWFKHGTSIEREAFGGWNISGIFTARAGVPFSVYDEQNEGTYYTVPRLTPGTQLSSDNVSKSPKAVGPNLFNGLNIPLPAGSVPLNSELGISDFGPFPANMMHRNELRGPGGWNADAAVQKDFPITERVGLQFRAEGFDFLNHHDYFVNTTTLAYSGSVSSPASSPLFVNELKGGLGSLAEGGNHDERRFGQFALKVTF